MQLTSATSTPASTGVTAPAAPSQSSSTISTQDFMQLLSTEMANQDPMQPMDPTQTMTQLAQFSTLQQTTTLNQVQGMATANALLGTQVTLPGSNGLAPLTGTVTAIDTSNVSSGGTPLLVVSGAPQEAPLTSVTQVTYAAATASAAAAAAAAPAATTTAAAAPAPAVTLKSTALQFLSQLL